MREEYGCMGVGNHFKRPEVNHGWPLDDEVQRGIAGFLDKAFLL